jgi:hypothetical protein
MMAVIQISRVQHRRGTSGELPDAMAESEIGFTTDTGEVFIGAPNHPKVAGRTAYPYENIKILTEFDVQRSITGDVYYHGPLQNLVVSDVNVLALFDVNTTFFGQFGIYDYSIADANGVKMGTVYVARHKNGALNSNEVHTMTAGSLINASVTISESAGQVIMTINNASASSVLSVSGREWVSGAG